MQRHLLVSLLLATLLAVGGCGSDEPGDTEAGPAAQTGDAESLPSIVLFVADDLGWADTSLTGSTFYETPNLEKLASDGTLFTSAWAAPVGRPTRAGLLTGRYATARFKIEGGRASREPRVPERDDPDQRMVRPERTPVLPGSQLTLAEILREAGYATGFYGKWDLGGVKSGPRAQGFDEFVVVPRLKTHFAPYRGVPALAGARKGEYLTDRLTLEATRFIEYEAGYRPFFLLLAHHAVHEPWQAKPPQIRKYRKKAAVLPPDAPQRNPVMGAMIESLDQSLGRVLERLEQSGVADRTIVIFLSDNGGVTEEFEGAPVTWNGPLRGGKRTTFEGGLRVPMVVRWPGVARPGVRIDAPVSHVDLFPTLLEAAGVTVPTGTGVDGEDLRPLLTGARQTRSRPVFSHHPLHDFSSAVREGRWKLIRYHGEGPDGSPRDVLYDLAEDPAESRDLAAQDPARARELGRLLDDWLAETGALLPVPNPAYAGPPAGVGPPASR